MHRKPKRRLYFNSFFPGAMGNPEIMEKRTNFYNNLAKEVLAKVVYFKEKYCQEVDTNGSFAPARKG